MSEPAPPATVGEALQFARNQIGETEAATLCCHFLGVNLLALHLSSEKSIDDEQSERICAATMARTFGQPLAYLVNHQGFWNQEFLVTPATMIPRSDTETLVELVLPWLSPRSRVLDLGTGCGAIGITLAQESGASVCVTDISMDALDCALLNAQELDADQIQSVHSDWYQSIPTQWEFDVVVSNPPYVPANDDHLLNGDLPHEPQVALVGGEDGLRDLRTVVAGAPAHLVAGGKLAVEHGYDQAIAVRGFFDVAGFKHIGTQPDIHGIPRVTYGEIA